MISSQDLKIKFSKSFMQWGWYVSVAKNETIVIKADSSYRDQPIEVHFTRVSDGRYHMSPILCESNSAISILTPIEKVYRASRNMNEVARLQNVIHAIGFAKHIVNPHNYGINSHRLNFNRKEAETILRTINHI